MNKNGFIDRLAKRTELSSEKAKVVTDAMIQIITEEMIGGIPVSFMGFGSFQPIQQVERLARNPRTGVPVMIKERKTVKFKVGKRLLHNMNAAKGKY